MKLRIDGLLGVCVTMALSLACMQSQVFTQTTATSPAAAAATAPTSQPASAPVGKLDAAHAAKARELMDRGAAYLLTRRGENGAWSAQQPGTEVPITAMVLKALVQHPKFGPKHPAVAKGFELMLKYKQPDGGIYEPSGRAASYTAAVALMAISAAKDPQYAETIAGLVKYLKGLQIVPGADSADKDDPRMGGVSYGKGPGRPDLSNVGMWMQALQDAGVPGDDPSIQQALAFVSRLQNHTETNALDWAKDGPNDGGFIYTFPGGQGAAQGIRSYGSMTYTGFKSMLYAGVGRKDSRVQAAFQWIRRYWRLDSNPNMPQAESRQGLYYYYHVFAKALHAWGEPVVTDLKGQPHNWRCELIDALASQIKADGSWANEADRWWEGEPVLTTSYALMALEETLAE